VRHALRIDGVRWSAFARPRGLAPDARPTHLDVWDWAALFTQFRRDRA
jgi:hypothetical protein